MKTELIAHCARMFGVSPSDVAGRSREPRYTYARFALYKILRMRGWSSKRIGKVMDRDHTTILYGVRRAEYLMEHDPVYAGRIKALAEWRPKPVEEE